jgi:hypothetical protein
VTRALAPQAADKLTKILGLLGSDYAGERDAAVRAAHKLVRSLGLSWSDIIAPPIVPHAPHIRAWRAQDDAWRRMARFCHNRRWALTGKEREFVETMMAWRGEPSDRQQDWLIDIYARLCREEAVA